MNLKMLVTSQTKSLSFIFTLVLISFLTIGGCSENNGGGGGVDAPPPAPQTMCTPSSMPCTSTIQNGERTIIECTSLISSACAVDLEEVMAQADPRSELLTGDTVMWIEAWGGSGGTSFKGPSGGAGGYAVTTTTVNDMKSKNSGSSVIYYFMGSAGIGGNNHCGSGGGVSTIITTEDLTLNPTSNPTQAAPPILLVAGGGAGGAGVDQTGLCGAVSGITSGRGGIAIAALGGDGQGAGGASNDPRTQDFFAKGGNEDGMGGGGVSGCIICNNQNNETAGTSGFGGLGGVGGSGPGCSGPGANNFFNSPVQLSMTSGLGGHGSSNQSTCHDGGGAGGGGYGGGGGGSQGDTNGASVSGGGGGSFAIQSTKSSMLAPTTYQTNPCGIEGCVRITFAP